MVSEVRYLVEWSDFIHRFGRLPPIPWFKGTNLLTNFHREINLSLTRMAAHLQRGQRLNKMDAQSAAEGKTHSRRGAEFEMNARILSIGRRTERSRLKINAKSK